MYAGVLNAGLQRGFKPPSGEVWTVELLRGEQKPSGGWQQDLNGIKAKMQQMKKHQHAMSKEGRELRRNSREMMRIAADRRKRAEQMRSEGRTAKQITEFLKTGKEPTNA